MKNLSLALLLFTACGTEQPGGPGGPGPDDDLGPFTEGVSTLTGHWDPGYVDGPRGTARFANPVNCAVGPDGKVYVADFDNGKIRAVDAASGQVATIVANEGFKRPFGMVFAGDTLYVTTDKNTTSDQQGPMTGTIWRVDIGAKTATPLAEDIGRPRGLAALPDGRIVLSDYQHHAIQIFDPGSRQLTPLAGAWDSQGMVDGAAAAAKFQEPYGLAVLDGKVLVADAMNNRIREISLDGTVATLAGSTGGFADGPVASAKFNRPQGVRVDSAGNIYVADTFNARIRKISGGTVTTIIGTGEAGYLDHDDALQAQIFGNEGLCVSGDGSRVFIADGGRGEDVPHNFIRVSKH